MKCGIILSTNINWYMVTFFLTIVLFIMAAIALLVLYKMKRLTIYNIINIIDVTTFVFLSILIFRTFYLFFASIIWIITYILVGLIKKKHKKIYWLNLSNNRNTKDNKIIKEIHNFKNNKRFIDIIRCFLDFMNSENLNKNKKSKFFLPIRFLFIGFIVPAINLFLTGSQYQNSHFLFLIFENYIFVFTFLYFAYPVAYYLMVKMETSKMFECKTLFHIGFVLFATMLVFAATVIPLNG